MWIREVLELKKFGYARLIPLNKAFPEIPTKKQFRPIIVLSALYKWLESRFLLQIKNFAEENLLGY